MCSLRNGGVARSSSKVAGVSAEAFLWKLAGHMLVDDPINSTHTGDEVL